MATLYNETLTGILDIIMTRRPVCRKPRSSDPWFDDECRTAMRLTGRLERAYDAAAKRGDPNLSSVESDWR